MQFHNQEQVMDWILDFANNTLEKTSGGWLAGVGVAFLFYTVGQLLSYVETPSTRYGGWRRQGYGIAR